MFTTTTSAKKGKNKMNGYKTPHYLSLLALVLIELSFTLNLILPERAFLGMYSGFSGFSYIMVK